VVVLVVLQMWALGVVVQAVLVVFKQAQHHLTQHFLTL
jgi:hypothetical protein